jgi:hypothetical protein
VEGRGCDPAADGPQLVAARLWRGAAPDGISDSWSPGGSRRRSAGRDRRSEAASPARSSASPRERGRHGGRPHRRTVGRNPSCHRREDAPGIRLAVAKGAGRGWRRVEQRRSPRDARLRLRPPRSRRRARRGRLPDVPRGLSGHPRRRRSRDGCGGDTCGPGAMARHTFGRPRVRVLRPGGDRASGGASAGGAGRVVRGSAGARPGMPSSCPSSRRWSVLILCASGCWASS